VGEPYGAQELVVVTKQADAQLHVEQVLGVAFVPLQEESGSAGRE
jgi:hypothetical protein